MPGMSHRALIAEREEGDLAMQLWEHVVDGKREHELVVNGVFLMASYNDASSRALMIEPLRRLSGDGPYRVLIAGLGMGFALYEASRCPKVERIDVVEIARTVVEWNRDHFREHNDSSLDDPRVHVFIEDAYDHVCTTDEVYDVIAVDVDNGPAMLVREANRRVYAPEFFGIARKRLVPGGILAMWSQAQAPELAGVGRTVFPQYETATVAEEHDGRTVSYCIHLWLNAPDAAGASP